MCRITCVPSPALPHLRYIVWPLPSAAVPFFQSSRPADLQFPASLLMALLTPCFPWHLYEYGRTQHSPQTLPEACAPCIHNPLHSFQTTPLSHSNRFFPLPSLSHLSSEAFPLLPSEFFKASQPMQVFPVLSIRTNLLFVSKWLKYSITPTFLWIFYYLVAMVLKACGGWLVFCPLVLTAQTHISLHCTLFS